MTNVYQCYYFIHYESNICIEKEEKVHCSELAFFVPIYCILTSRTFENM